jgi:hypothetical protein
MRKVLPLPPRSRALARTRACVRATTLRRCWRCFPAARSAGSWLTACQRSASSSSGCVCCTCSVTLARRALCASSARWRRRCALANARSSRRKKRGLAMAAPSEQVAKVASPTSMPTSRPVGGTGVGFHSLEMVTYHLPVAVRRIVAVLGVPSSGRWAMILLSPTFDSSSRLPLALSPTPLSHCGSVSES